MAEKKMSVADIDFSTLSKSKFKTKDKNGDNNNYGDEDDALTAEFRARIGLLSEEEMGLSDAFKAHLGLGGLDEVGETAEVTIQQDWEKDDTIASFKYPKFAAEFFQAGQGPDFYGEYLREPLLTHENDIDRMAALAVWIAVQRFMGDDKNEPQEIPVRVRTPVMTTIYNSLERHTIRKKQGLDRKQSIPEESEHKEPEVEGFKVEKRRRSSIKQLLGKLSANVERSSEKRRASLPLSPKEVGPTYLDDENARLENIPTHEIDLIHFITGHGILRRSLRDEIFCQVCKQLTKNPNKSSEIRGWMIIALLVGCFLPSKKFINYFKNFIKSVSVENKETYGSYIRRLINRTLQNGTRYHPPNWLELQSVHKRKYVLLPVTMADGRVESVEADSASTAEELCKMVADKLELKDQFGFSIYVCIFEKVSSLGSGNDHVMDAISECEQVVRSRGMTEEDAPWRLFYRKELFSPWHDPTHDEKSTNLIYQQFMRGLRSREYKPENEQSMAELVAKIYYLQKKGEVIPGILNQELHVFLSSRYLMNRSRESWIQSILAATDNLGLVTKKTDRKQLMEDLTMFSADQWYLQFSGLFEAFRIAGPTLPRNDVVVAINHIGLFIMHEPFKVCASHAYCDIVDASSSRTSKKRGQSFNVTTVNGTEYSFLSPNAQNMSLLVSSFLEGLRRRSRFAVALSTNKDTGKKQDGLLYSQGDLIRMIEAAPGNASDGTHLMLGNNERSGQRGNFSLDDVYIIPCIERPPPEFLARFEKMDSQITATLPRKRSKIMLGKETVGRHKKFGLDSAV